MQEVVDSNYGRDVPDTGKRPAERSKSAPSGSPKAKRKDTKKKKNKVEHTNSQSSLRSVRHFVSVAYFLVLLLIFVFYF